MKNILFFTLLSLTVYGQNPSLTLPIPITIGINGDTIPDDFQSIAYQEFQDYDWTISQNKNSYWFYYSYFDVIAYKNGHLYKVNLLLDKYPTRKELRKFRESKFYFRCKGYRKSSIQKDVLIKNHKVKSITYGQTSNLLDSLSHLGLFTKSPNWKAISNKDTGDSIVSLMVSDGLSQDYLIFQNGKYRKVSIYALDSYIRFRPEIQLLKDLKRINELWYEYWEKPK